MRSASSYQVSTAGDNWPAIPVYMACQFSIDNIFYSNMLCHEINGSQELDVCQQLHFKRSLSNPNGIPGPGRSTFMT